MKQRKLFEVKLRATQLEIEKAYKVGNKPDSEDMIQVKLDRFLMLIIIFRTVNVPSLFA